MAKHKDLPWFRMHTEIMDDEKLADFTGDEFRVWVFLLCLARKSSVGGIVGMDTETIAWKIRQPVALVQATLAKCEARGMVSRESHALVVPNWAARQYEKPSAAPDKSAARKAKSRAVTPKSRAGHAASRAPSVQIQSTETDTEKAVQHATPPAPLVLTPPKSRKPKPEPNPEHAEFIALFDRLYSEANAGKRPTWNAMRGAQVKSLLKAHGLSESVRRAELMFSAGCPDWIAKGGRDLGTLVAQFDKLAVAAPPPGKPAVVDHDYRASRALAGFPVDAPPEPSPPEAGAYLLPPSDKHEYRRVRFR